MSIEIPNDIQIGMKVISTPRLSRKEAQSQTHEKLLNAASLQIARKGFEAASIRDIAGAAGFSQGAFHSNFETKDDVILQLAYRKISYSTSLLEKALDSAGDDYKAAMHEIKTWIESLNCTEDETLLSIEIELYAKRNPKFAHKYYGVVEDHRKVLASLLSRIFKMNGVKPPAPIMNLATGFLGLMRGVLLSTKPGDQAKAGAIILTFLKALISAGEKL